MASRCWVVGSAVLDNVLATPRLPKPGESVFAESFNQYLGGKGVNQAVACARQGAKTEVFACLGKDPAGDRFFELFESEGLGLEGVVRDAGAPTGQAAITLAHGGLNQIVVYPGANMALPAQAIHNADIQESDVVLCQFEVPDEVIEAASRRGRFVLNPAPYREFPSDALARCFALTPNETEAESLTGIATDTDQGLERCARALLSMGVLNVVITLGARGVYLVGASGHRLYPAPRVEAVDTTAAGDVFNGALAARLSLGDPLDQAIPYAVVAASLSVTKSGAVPSIPDALAVQSFIALNS